MDALVEDRRETPPANLLVPRDGAAELAAALAVVRATEGERRWGNVVKYMSGWVVAALLVYPLGKSLEALQNRPVPKDRIWVALQHEDGSISNAKPIEDQTPSERENTIYQFMYDYVDYRMSYDVAHIQRNYDRTRFTSAGEAQREYVRQMTDDPDRPTELLGPNGERRVTSESVSRVGPDAFEVLYSVKIKTKQGAWLPEEHRRARITYSVFADMPPEIARRIDPLKLVTIVFSDHPATYDPTVPGGAR